MMNKGIGTSGYSHDPTKGCGKSTTFKDPCGTGIMGGSSGEGPSGGNRRTDTTLAQAHKANGVSIKGDNPTNR